MKERPIIFSSEMVRAILDGRKTQTRRPIKPQPTFKYPGNYKRGMVYHHGYNGNIIGTVGFGLACEQWDFSFSLYGIPGDRLWVRETGWQRPQYIPGKWLRDGADTWPEYIYDADGIDLDDIEDLKDYGWKRSPSIHMPRWASRITLEIEDVRVERVQEISEEDARAEGIAKNPVQEGTWIDYPQGTSAAGWKYPTKSFRSLWNSIYAKKGFGWDVNPWVWAITFKRVEAKP
jgi:hypothetical protein